MIERTGFTKMQTAEIANLSRNVLSMSTGQKPAEAISSRGTQLTEDHFRLLVEGVKDYAIFMLNPEGLVVTWNQGAERIKGYRPEEILGRHFSVFYPEAEAARGEPMRALESALAQGRHESEGWRLRRDGKQFWASVLITPVREPSGKLIGFCKVTRDITDRMRTEEALRKSEERHRLFFDSNLAASIVFTPTGELLGCNPAFVRMFGFASAAEALEQNLATLYVDPWHFEQFVLAIQQHRALGYCQQELRRKDGTRVYVVQGAVGTFGEKGELIQILGHFIEETERRRTEERLRQDQKMNTVGRLSGGIAHDFNNMLGIIVGCGEVLNREIKAGDPLRKHLDVLLDATRRGAKLTRQLLTFSRRQILKIVTLNLNTVIVDLSQLLPRLMGEDIELITHLDPNLGSVRGDQNHLEQVVVNLAANARDAMPEGGRLLIETRNVKIDAKDVERNPALSAGEWVKLTLSDNGIGMDEATCKQIFEPFFSTKQFGNGNGLGLSIVYGIVKQSGGLINVQSEPGVGTTFNVYLPFVPEAPTNPVAEPAFPEGQDGKETVLLVEDEEALLEITAEHLAKLGYTVLKARNGEEALAVAAQQGKPIHLLITDIVMPGMTGKDMANLLLSTHGALPVLYVSGYANHTIAEEGLLGPGVDFLQKPYGLRDLNSKIRKLLGEVAGARPSIDLIV
jgi:two-component system, cell cycle sensor histidine kinase and response regulator CckA